MSASTFLSGGLDSGIISAIAARAMQEKGETLHTFSVDYRDNAKYFHRSKFQPTSDTDYIYKPRDTLRCTHHMVVLDTEDLVEALFEAVDALEALLAGGKSEPWYGRLMIAPQTIAYMLQLNYWLRKYRAELV